MNTSTVAIIGAAGAMGGMLAERAEGAGFTVRRLDKPLAEADLAGSVPDAEIVLLSVPAEAVHEAAAAAARHMSGDQLLADVCSVKVRPVEAMLDAYTGPVAGTHPMFGPEPGEGPLKVAVTEGRGKDSITRAAGFMQKLGFEPFETGAEEHDRSAAFIQGLNFVTTVSYLATLSHRPEALDFVTPSFRRRLEAARKMLTQDKDMFCALFEANPYAQEAVRAFRGMLNLAAGGDVDLLAERARWWWREDDTDGGA